MSDSPNVPNDTDSNEQGSGSSRVPCKPRSRVRRGLFLATVALAGGMAGAFATKAVGHGFGWRGHFGHGPGFIHARGTIDPERAAKRAGRMARHLGAEVDTTPDQQAKLNTIAQGLVADILPMRQKLRDARKRGVDLMTAAVVDRTAIEAFRSEQVATAEQLTKRLTTALSDAAEVLTPQQRAQLAERIGEWRERRGWFHHGKRGHHRRDSEQKSD